MKIFILLLISLISFGCNKKEVIYEDTTTDFLKVKTEEVEVYNDIFLKDVIEVLNNDIEITSDNYKIDTTKLGNQDFEVFYTYNDKKYVFKSNLKIVDTTPPLVFSGTNKTVTLDYDKDLCNLITYGDNYSREVKCEIKGDYDLSKVGTYKLVYNLNDDSNNLKSVNVTLNVVKKIKNQTTTSNTKTMFQDVITNYKNDKTEIGIDVSKWQGKIDFQKVKESGASFVLIRLGAQGSNKKLVVDEYYKENIKNAKEAGLKVGVYLYSIATSLKDAKEQAKFVINTLDGEKLDLPIVFDWESWSNWNSYKISFYDINNIANTFIKEIKNNDYEGMLYSSKFYLETIWTKKDDYPIWLAHYTKKTDYKGKYQIWQLCNNGRISGINGAVDIDVMYLEN